MIRDRIECLADDQGVNGNYAYHLGQMEEQVLAARMNNHQKLLQKQVGVYLAKERKQQGQINQL